MNAKLYRENAEVRDSDITYSSVGPGHERASFCLIPLAGYAARSRFSEFPYFNGPFHIYSMSGWKGEMLFKSIGSAKAAIRRWVLKWIEAPGDLTWNAVDTGVHWTATAGGIQIANYYFCPEARGNWHKDFRVWFGGTYYTTAFQSPVEARNAVQATFSRWLDHAKASLLHKKSQGVPPELTLIERQGCHSEQ